MIKSAVIYRSDMDFFKPVMDQQEKENSISNQDKNDERHQDPHLVFTDPDSFFHDLLMEQQEQH